MSSHLNVYHDQAPAVGQDAPVWSLIAKAKQGVMTQAEFKQISTGHHSIFDSRQTFVQAASWAAFTVEWMNSLANLVKLMVPNVARPSVLEVCAGQGLLARPMADRGITWMCTEYRPPIGSPNDIRRMPALRAAKTLSYDILFASWIPYLSPLDFQLARLGKPCIFVGESSGGCTGSQRFWGSYWHGGWHRTVELPIPYRIIRARSFIEGFQDVPQWPGIHDVTHITFPKEGNP